MILKFLVTMVMFWSTVGYADDLHILSLDEFTFDTYRIINHRDPYYPYGDMGSDGEHWDKGVAADFNIDLLKYQDFDFYWRNRVHGESTDQQFREVGWQFETGLELRNYVQLYYQHHSQHILDAEGQYGKYPLENYVGVRMTLYKRGR
jgi:hypothetical protein